MAESKLPPGPWRVVGVDICDATGLPVEASPEVLRAVEALPGLVEAARKLMSWVKVERRSGLELPYSIDMCVAALGDALARVDADRPPDDIRRMKGRD